MSTVFLDFSETFCIASASFFPRDLFCKDHIQRILTDQLPGTQNHS